MISLLPALLGIVICGITLNAMADESCPPNNFGQHPTPPRPLLPPPVNNSYGHFDYGSDVVSIYGTLYSSNYIWNKGIDNLAADWHKVGIKQVGPNTIPAGQAVCQTNPIADEIELPNIEQYIDHDAPITYSSANRVQPAWAYTDNITTLSGKSNEQPLSKEHPAQSGSLSRRAFSTFATSYLTLGGELRPVNIMIESVVDIDKNEIELIIRGPSGKETLGINIVQLYGLGALDSAKSAFTKQGYKVEIDSLLKKFGPETTHDLVGDDEPASTALLLFMRGDSKAFTVIPMPRDSRVARKRSFLVLLDADNRPIAADAIGLYGLTRK